MRKILGKHTKPNSFSVTVLPKPDSTWNCPKHWQTHNARWERSTRGKCSWKMVYAKQIEKSWSSGELRIFISKRSHSNNIEHYLKLIFSMTAVDIWDKLWGIALGGGIRYVVINQLFQQKKEHYSFIQCSSYIHVYI